MFAENLLSTIYFHFFSRLDDLKVIDSLYSFSNTLLHIYSGRSLLDDNSSSHLLVNWVKKSYNKRRKDCVS
jgi:hypothetical protein